MYLGFQRSLFKRHWQNSVLSWFLYNFFCSLEELNWNLNPRFFKSQSFLMSYLQHWKRIACRCCFPITLPRGLRNRHIATDSNCVVDFCHEFLTSHMNILMLQFLFFFFFFFVSNLHSLITFLCVLNFS